MKRNLLTILLAATVLGCGGGEGGARSAPTEQQQAVPQVPSAPLAARGVLTGSAEPGDLPHLAVAPVSLVQANGDRVAVYQRVRRATPVDPSRSHPHQEHVGLYLQRLGESGAALQPETEVASIERLAPGVRHDLVDIRTLALSDGGVVVSWGVAFGGGLGANQVDFFMRRFDPSGAPVGDLLQPVQNYWCANRHLNSTFEWDADDAGGFSVTGTIHPKAFDGDEPCGGYGPPVQKQVYTYYPGPEPAAPASQAKFKACTEGVNGVAGEARKVLVATCLAQ